MKTLYTRHEAAELLGVGYQRLRSIAGKCGIKPLIGKNRMKLMTIADIELVRAVLNRPKGMSIELFLRDRTGEWEVQQAFSDSPGPRWEPFAVDGDFVWWKRGKS